MTLGPDFRLAVAEANEWNRKLDEYRLSVHGQKPRLNKARPMSAADIARRYESSPRFALYRERTRQDYASCYWRLETLQFDGRRMFGDVDVSKITRKMAYGIYEHHLMTGGYDSANKTMTAWQAVFKYATLKIPGVTCNPFTQLDKHRPPPWRQIWTDEQLQCFIRTAEAMGYAAVARCALMCVDPRPQITPRGRARPDHPINRSRPPPTNASKACTADCRSHGVLCHSGAEEPLGTKNGSFQ